MLELKELVDIEVSKLDTQLNDYFIYTTECVQRCIIDDSMVNEMIENNCCFGTLDCIIKTSADMLGVGMSDVAFTIKKFYIKDGSLRALIDILDNENGKVLHKAINDNSVKFSLLGAGYVDFKTNVVTEFVFQNVVAKISPDTSSKSIEIDKISQDTIPKPIEIYYSDSTSTQTQLNCDKCPNKPDPNKVVIGDTPCTWCKKNQITCTCYN